jgi:DNA-binding NarL/FixJ family response regulator
MRFPQILVYETERRLARLLEDDIKANQRKWSLRELRRMAACLPLLRRGGPNVLVLHVSRPQVHDLTVLEDLKAAYPKMAAQLRYLARQMDLLQRVHWLATDTATLVVGDTEDAALAELAWDLGADYVLFPPQPLDQLSTIVAELIRSATQLPDG